MIIKAQDEYYCRSYKLQHSDEFVSDPFMQFCARDDGSLEETVDYEPVHVSSPTMITIDDDKPDPKRKKRTDPLAQTPQRDPVEPSIAPVLVTSTVLLLVTTNVAVSLLTPTSESVVEGSTGIAAPKVNKQRRPKKSYEQTDSAK